MRKLLLAMLGLSCSASEIQAMHLDRSGLGQVLVSPFYTVNGGNQTLITVANRTDRGKALKLRFLEGMNGREVFDFNLYLAPHDLWTAAVFSQLDDGPATLITVDDSCTVPAIKTSTVLPQLTTGRRIAPFSNFQYTGARDDAGPDNLLRTREGYFEIIEMGEVINAAQRSLNDISPGNDGLPANCPRIHSAWATGGYWAMGSETDITAPGGGLTATVSLVDALEGTMYTFQPEAIDRFSSIVQHTAPGSPVPNLASGVSSLSQGLVEAVVEIDGALITAQYPIARAVDAVSALFMAESISNEFATAASSGGASSWVVTLPTRKFYTDNAIVQSVAIAPFTTTFSATNPHLTGWGTIYPPPLPMVAAVQTARGEALEAVVRDRERGRFECGGDNICVPYPQATRFSGVPSIHWATSIFAFNTPNCTSLWQGPYSSPGPHSSLCQSIDPFHAGISDGWLNLRFYNAQGNDSMPLHRLRADNAGHRFAGLPAIGFWAASFTNGQLRPGVLSNYASLRRHKVAQRDVPVVP